jgi:hypothetical protein
MRSEVNAPKPSARERLLAAADELFFHEGVQSVGVDRVVQKAGLVLQPCRKQGRTGPGLPGRPATPRAASRSSAP